MPLVLGRKVGETIKIRHGEDIIELMVVRLKGKKCRLSFSGSKTFNVWRAELGDLPPAEQEAALEPSRPRRGEANTADFVPFPHGRQVAPPAEELG